MFHKITIPRNMNGMIVEESASYIQLVAEFIHRSQIESHSSHDKTPDDEPA